MANNKETPHPAGGHVHTQMHRHNYSRFWPLSHWQMYCVVFLPSQHCHFSKLEERAQSDSGEPPLHRHCKGACCETSWKEIEMLFTIVSAIVIKPMAVRMFPSIIIEHKLILTVMLTHTRAHAGALLVCRYVSHHSRFFTESLGEPLVLHWEDPS